MSEILSEEHQPTLPPEGEWYETELQFMEEEPPSFFPQNQNSNFGWIIRHVFAKFTQDIAGLQTLLYNERFVATSETFLDQWEIEVGLTPNPEGKSIAQRRSEVLARLQRGPFTRTRRDAVISNAISVTFGTTVQLLPPGIPLTFEGIPLYSEPGETEMLFSVTEYPDEFRYVVNIDPDTDPDIDAITRELERITPAGITFTITRDEEAALTYEMRTETYPTYDDTTDTGGSYEDVASGEL
jgi:hypothetical protein